MKTWKDRVTSDYSHIKGVHHAPWPGKSLEQLDRELGYAERIGLNSVRLFMQEQSWYRDPAAMEKLNLDYVRLCAKHNLSVMPILFNGNGYASYEPFTPVEFEKKREYINAMVALLKPEPNVFMWDVCNEPFCNNYLRFADAEEYARGYANIRADLRVLVQMLREADDDTPITVGHELAPHLESTRDLVDVICFHDYLTNSREIEEAYAMAKRVGIEEGGKPVMNSETGCLGRANPYDLELQFCDRYHYGYYIFNLVIEGFWGALHGIVYPDGTVRDPGIIAAIHGFYRNRSENRIPTAGNREGYAEMAVERVKKALTLQRTGIFSVDAAASVADTLEACEICVNILECNELVPMDNPPSVKLNKFRSVNPDDIDVTELREYAFGLAQKLKEVYCLF